MLKKSHHHLYQQRNAIRKKIIKKNVLNVPEELLSFSDSSKSSEPEKSPEKQSFKSPGQQSSRSIKQSTKSLITSSGLPKIAFSELLPEIQNKIMGYVIPDNYSLHEWVDDSKLVVKHLCKNPNAISFLKAIFDLPIEKYNALPENKKIDWKILSENQNAMYLIKKKVLLESKLKASEYNALSENKKIDWKILSKNPNAIHLLMKNQSKINWEFLSENPNAIQLLKKNKDKISIYSLLKNKNLDITLLETILERILYDIDVTKREDPLLLSQLWRHPIGIKILVENYNESPKNAIWSDICENHSTFAINIVKQTFIKEQAIKEDVETYDYKLVSLNPKAIQFLTENPDIIYWPFLSLNPKAIKLLTERAYYESTLKPETLRTTPNKISWSELSKNPKANKLLTERAYYESTLKPEALRTILNKISWSELSKNPSAIRLLDKKLIEESPTGIPSNLLRLHHGISLENLCQNINAVKLLKKCIDNIKDTKHWEFLSENPCIFKDN